MFNSEYVGQCLPSINLENMDYHDHQMIINSPRSLNICQKNNVDIKDLYFYNFYEFRNNNPEITSKNIDAQKHTYNQKEEARQLLLSKLIKERRELINNENALNLKQKKENKETKEENKKQKEIEKKKKRNRCRS